MIDEVEDDEYHYTLKDLYTVDGLINNRGHEVERYTYDAYGNPSIYAVPIEDVDYSGSVDALDESDISLRIGQNVCNYGPIYDLDDDGDIDQDDVDVADGAGGNSVTELRTSGVRNAYLFTGRRLFALDADLISLGPVSNQPVQYNRNRHYDPEHGRWLQRDPLAYVDGMNLYEYVRSNSASQIDPNGLFLINCSWGLQGNAVMNCFDCVRGTLSPRKNAQDAEKIGRRRSLTVIIAKGWAAGGVEHRALRHCIASAYLALKETCSRARCFAELREAWQTKCKNQAPRDEQRANNNDRVGRGCARCKGDERDGSRSDGFFDRRPPQTIQDLVDCCVERMDSMDLGAGPPPKRD